MRGHAATVTATDVLVLIALQALIPEATSALKEDRISVRYALMLAEIPSVDQSVYLARALEVGSGCCEA